MGCCQSKADDFDEHVEGVPSPPRVSSLHQGRSLPGLQVHAFCAAWRMGDASRDYTFIKIDGSLSLFAVLFDPHTRPEAAKFCTENCWDAFTKCMLRSHGDPEKALKGMYAQLDRMFFKSKASQLVKATSGCSGVALYLDFTKRKCYVANLGTSHCILGWSAGAFNARSCDGRVLTQDHSARDLVEQTVLRERFPNESDIVMGVGGSPRLKGITKMSRCIGYGFGKDGKLAGVFNAGAVKQVDRQQLTSRPLISTDTHVSIHDISEEDEHLVLVSESVMRLVSPVGIALYCSQLSHQNLMALYRTFIKPFDGGMIPQHHKAMCSPAAALVRHVVSHANELPKVPENLSAVVVSLDWVRSATGCLLANLVGRTPDSPKLSAYRWHLVQLLCKFLIERRRTMLAKWWSLVDDVVEQARECAQETEVAAWVTHNTVLNLSGTSVTSSGRQSTSFWVNYQHQTRRAQPDMHNSSRCSVEWTASPKQLVASPIPLPKRLPRNCSHLNGMNYPGLTEGRGNLRGALAHTAGVKFHMQMCNVNESSNNEEMIGHATGTQGASMPPLSHLDIIQA